MTLRPTEWIWEVLGFLWALPVSVLGMVLVLASGGGQTFRTGLRWVVCLRWPWWMGRFAGMGLGCFILLKPANPSYTLLTHEAEHVRQCFILGPIVIVLYPLLSLVAWVCYGSPYRFNWMEIMARHRDGRAKL
jgi:hypothetical protein